MALAALAIAGLSAFLAAELAGGPDVGLPPGCDAADKNIPGCRPIDKGTSANTVAIVSLIVTPLGALTVAWLTTRAARRTHEEALAAEQTRLTTQLRDEHDRLNQQVRHETERLEAQLRHESERLRTQLEHERTRRDVDDVRRLIDHAMEQATLAVDAFTTLVGLAQDTEHPLDEAKERRLGEAAEALKDLWSPMWGHAVRFVVRLGTDHALFKTYNALQRASRPTRLLELTTTVPDIEKRQAEIAKLDDQHTHAYTRFIMVASATAGWELPEGTDRSGEVLKALSTSPDETDEGGGADESELPSS